MGIGYSEFTYLPARYRQREQQEADLLLRTGATPQPLFKPLRPIKGFFSLCLLSYGISRIFTPPSPEAYTFANTCFGAYFTGSVTRDYFLDQHMTPPSPKKSFWQTVLARIRPSSVSIPVEQPATPYSLHHNL